MDKILIIAFLLTSIIAKGQSEKEITYYSDKYGYKEVSKGPYKKELKKVNDIITEIFTKTENEQIIWTKSYIEGQSNGVLKWFNNKGKTKSVSYYDFDMKYGEMVPQNSVSLKALGLDEKSDKNLQKIQRHIRENFRYPREAMLNRIQGTVTVQFTINENGQVGNLRILEGAHLLLDTESFRIMNLLKQLEPYEKNGQKVMVYYTTTIKFVMQAGKSAIIKGNN